MLRYLGIVLYAFCVAWWHQAIAWTIVDLSSKVLHGIRMTESS